ncbi:MAG: 3-phosphoshikimate 1-carboxyvinyltransferase [Fibrobacterota bacterium]
MIFTISPSKLKGEIRVPGSKSHSIRAIIFALLAKGESIIINGLISDDTRSCLSAASSLGADVDLRGNSWKIVSEGPENFQKTSIDVGNSGTTLRLLTAAAAVSEKKIFFDGDESIRKRPMGPLLRSLSDLGAKYSCKEKEGFCPFSIKGPCGGGKTTVDGTTSQFLSAILISAPLFPGNTVLETPRLNEKPYVQITLDWLKSVEADVKQENMKIFQISGNKKYRPLKTSIPGDFSAAAFPLTAALITKSDILIKGLDMKDPQGDKELFEIVSRMGGNISETPEGIMVKGSSSELRGAVIDLNNTPDALPAAAVICAYAEGLSEIVNVEHARIKESDRISVMCAELRKMGASITEKKDGLIIEGGHPLKGARVEGEKDHRIVMALSCAGMGAEGETEVTCAEAASVTFPEFYDRFRELGARIEKA